ncbi:hypothetical protein [Alteribacter populi]|uniref:hypothetical protein n=1 Tax=Alteribacter populi TaxID=2011011 RepID=UPI0012FE5DBD|nr:hypothetical protein [Alteribacter populi]
MDRDHEIKQLELTIKKLELENERLKNSNNKHLIWMVIPVLGMLYGIIFAFV